MLPCFFKAMHLTITEAVNTLQSPSRNTEFEIDC